MRGKGKGKKVKFTIEQATKAQRGSRGIALLFFNLGTRWGGASFKMDTGSFWG